MKKILCFILTIIMIISSISIGLVSYAYNGNNKLYNFAEDLADLIREYNVVNISDEEAFKEIIDNGSKVFSATNYTDRTDFYQNLFETRRIIVKSSERIDYRGAIDCVSGYNDLYVLQYDSAVEAEKAYEYYLTLPCVEYVEADRIVNAQDDVENPNIFIPEIIDPEVSASEILDWLSNKIGFNDIKDTLAGRIVDNYVEVAIIDSGADMDHDLLKDRVIETGINFSGSGNRNSCEDDYGHGTHVAGIVVSNTLENVKIKPYKVLNEEGKGSLSAIATAIDLAVAEGANVINLSLTAKGESVRLTEAVDNAVAQNVNVVVAAGNNKADLDRVYYTPACVESAITVSATDDLDKLAKFSNYDGPIDIAAPGTDIKSSYLNNAYAILSGTSMAAPQVTAGLAIVRSVYPDLLASEVESRLEDYAIKLFENPDENHFGAGLLFIKYLLDEKPTTSSPTFSVDSCSFSTNFDLKITCAEENATIYYGVGRIGDEDVTNWIKFGEYTEPIKISVDTRIAAFAVGKGKKPSPVVTASYDRVVDKEEDNYEINTLGYITAYYGNEVDLIVPEIIKGKKVKGIASSAFEDDFRIKTVVLPDSATKINSKAFKGCSALEFVCGNGVTEIGASAFELSSITSLYFPELTTIGNKAFSECSQLTTIAMPKLQKVGSYAFQKTPELIEVNFESVLEIGASAFEESGVKTVNLPNVTVVDMNAFASCENLISVSMSKITELTVGVFKNCTALKSVDMNLLTKIGSNSFRNTGLEKFFGRFVESVGNYAFAESSFLAEAILPMATSTGTNAFADCSELQVVMLPSLVELNNNSFYNCQKLKMLYLPAVKTVGTTAFKQSSIEYIRFNCVEEIKSLPDTLKGIVLPSTLISITAKVPSTDFIVYGYENTYAQQFAVNNNKEFYTVPAILYDTVEEFNPEDTYIVVYAMGFDCSYQWYKNSIVSNVGGTPIDGANYFYYKPAIEDEAASYYCVITSTDGINSNSTTTNPIINAPELRPADLTEYNKVLEKVEAIDRDSADEEFLKEIDDLLRIDVSNLNYDSQHIVDSIVEEIEMILQELENGFLIGDANHDHEISAYDARLVLCYASGDMVMSNHQRIVSDMNGDGQVTAIDARLILIKVIELQKTKP